jgi:hypothetical protein
VYGPVLAKDPGAYSDGEILAYMNEIYEGVVPSAEKPKAAEAAKAAAEAEGAKPALSAKPAEEAAKPADAAAKPAPPPAISNQMASERAAPVPEGFEKLTGKARTRAIAEMLKNGTLPGLTKQVG